MAAAGVEFDENHIAPVPLYFSGTNARAYHWATLTGETLGITRTEMWVGDHLVAEQNYPAPNYGNLYIHDAGHSVMFDSSEFGYLESVPVTLIVWTTDGGPGIEDQWTAPCKNNVALFGRYDLEGNPMTWDDENNEYDLGDSTWAGIPSVYSRLVLMGYDIENSDVFGPDVSTRYWDFDTLSGPIGSGEKVCSIFYVNSHGAGGDFWTDSNDYNLTYPNDPPLDEEMVFGYHASNDPPIFQLGPIREAGMGTGLPPFNSTENPPINLALIDACYTAGTNDFAQALLIPFGNYFNPPYSSECQSQVGYAVKVVIQSTQGNNWVFWNSLMEGNTVHQARLEVYDSYSSQYQLEQEGYQYFMIVWGDHHTRLNGVYTGTGSDSPMEDFSRSY